MFFIIPTNPPNTSLIVGLTEASDPLSITGNLPENKHTEWILIIDRMHVELAQNPVNLWPIKKSMRVGMITYHSRANAALYVISRKQSSTPVTSANGCLSNGHDHNWDDLSGLLGTYLAVI